MIKVNDLRIGNLILPRTGTEEHVKVTDIDEYGSIGTEAYFYDGAGTTGTTSEIARGIPLTPEWLERCGFTTDGQGDDNHPHPLWQHPDTEYQFSDGSLVHNGQAYDDWHDIGNVDYIHQLQNLFFFVVGQELDIKLP